MAEILEMLSNEELEAKINTLETSSEIVAKATELLKARGVNVVGIDLPELDIAIPGVVKDTVKATVKKSTAKKATVKKSTAKKATAKKATDKKAKLKLGAGETPVMGEWTGAEIMIQPSNAALEKLTAAGAVPNKDGLFKMKIFKVFKNRKNAYYLRVYLEIGDKKIVTLKSANNAAKSCSNFATAFEQFKKSLK